MKSTQILVVSFLLIGCLLAFLSIRGRRATAANASAEAAQSLDASWNYQIGLPVIPPDHDASLTFEVKPAPSVDQAKQIWLAKFSGNDHTALFTIEIDPSDRTETHGIPMHFGKGRITANPDSDDRSLLPSLAFALGGSIPSNITKQHVLPFDYVHFGDNLSAIPGGGFQFKPAGDWTAMKLFFDGTTEDDHGTVYFSIAPRGGVAQFSMSNSDYGDIVLRHLAKVL